LFRIRRCSSLFLLLKTQDLTSEVFICPSSQGERDTFESKTSQDRSNFTGQPGTVVPNLTYSYIVPFPSQTAMDAGFKLNYTLTSDFAIAADINPGNKPTGTAGQQDNIKGVDPKSARKDMSDGNSNNHNGDGQNVLYADGHVEFQNTPFCGMQRGTTAANGFRGTPLARGTTAGAMQFNVGDVKFQTKDRVDVAMATVTIDPLGHSGWHSHPGVVLVTVTSGTVTFYQADCSFNVYPAGSTFVESNGATGLARNESATVPAVVYVTYVVPVGAALRIDQPDPGCPLA